MVDCPSAITGRLPSLLNLSPRSHFSSTAIPASRPFLGSQLCSVFARHFAPGLSFQLHTRICISDGIFPPGFRGVYAHHLDCFHSTLASHLMCVCLNNAKMVRLTGSCLGTVADLDGRNSGIHRKALYCAGAQGLPSSLAAIAAELRDGLRSACTHPLVRFTSFYMLSNHADLLLDPGLWCGETKLSPAIWSLHPELSTEMIVVKSGMEVSSLGWTTKTSHAEVRLAG